MTSATRVTWPVALVLSLALVAAAAIFMYMQGRPAICPCGFVKFYWLGPKGQPEESQHFLDIYSATHVLHGVLFYFLIWLVTRGRLSILAMLVVAVLLESLWEVFENSNYMIRRYQEASYAGYVGDSVINAVGDVATMVVGFLIAALLPAWLTFILFIGAEVGLALLIRDNLSLNILNLVYPIDWIQSWQDGK
jgi:hypothetical protein